MKHFLLPAFLLGLTAPALAQSLTFSPVVAYGSGGSGTSGVAVADLNGDGKPDIVVSNTSATVGVLLGIGTGTFPATATAYPSGATSGNASAVAVGDVNADGKPDLVVLNTNDSTVGLLLGTGTGAFQAAVTYPTASFAYPGGLAVADVNADGRADVLVANTMNGTVGVLLSRSAGGLAAATQVAAGGSGGSPQSLAAGDLNGDGKPDLAVGTSGGGVLVMLGNGAGGFATTATAYPSGGSSVQRVRVADVTGDGKPDVVTANTFENSVSVLPGTGTGTLGAAASYAAGGGSAPPSVAVGDLNKDGRPDLVAANYGYNTVGVLLAQAVGGFPATATQFSAGSNSAPNDVVVADVNGDGKPDIITANFTTSQVGVLLNTSVLATQSAQLAAGVGLYPNPVAVGEVELTVTVPAVAGASQVQLTLRTALGQVVHRLSGPLPAAGARLTLGTAGLAAGVYLLQLQAGDQVLARHVVVE